MTSHRRAPQIPDVPPFRGGSGGGGGPLQARGVPNQAVTTFDARGYPMKGSAGNAKWSAGSSSKAMPPPPLKVVSSQQQRQGGAASASSSRTTRTAQRPADLDAPQSEPRPSSRLANEKKKDYKDPPYIGPWKLGKLIGQGASGRVRHAVHTTSGVQAAVKIVPKQILASSRMSIRDVSAKQDKMTLGIEREIVIMKLIEHPNVLGLMDVYETSKELYLILEYVAGGELFDYLVSKGRLRPPEARAYFRQIIFGLHYCHSFNICHRDLKPENLLLDGSRRVVKVADFGMAALQPNEKMLETSCGSPHYASPEIVSGKSYKGTASDIWSCGIILFALLCGRLPFDDPNIQTLLGKVRNGKFDMPDYLEPSAKDLIWRMLTVDPERRLNMRDVMRHPWFTDNGELSDHNPVSTNIDEIVEEQMVFANLDMDILSNLKTLWPEYSQEDIVAQLTSKGHNWQKTFYSLLIQHRENYSGDDEDDSESEEAEILVAEPGRGKTSNSLGLSLGIETAPNKPASPQPPRSPQMAAAGASPATARATLLAAVPANASPSGPTTPLRSPVIPTADTSHSPMRPQDGSTRSAGSSKPQPSVHVTPGSPGGKRPLPQPATSSSGPSHASPVRSPMHVPTTGFGSAQHAQQALHSRQQRESGVVDTMYRPPETRTASPSRALYAPPLVRGHSEQARPSSPATPDRSRLRSTSMADDSTPKQALPMRPSSRASSTRPRSGQGRSEDRAPTLDPFPQEESASMQQFFREFADEIAAIRVNGERPISLQRKLEQLERLTEQAQRNSLRRSQSPRRRPEDDPMAQFDDAEDDCALDDGYSTRSGTASESSGYPFTPTSPASLALASPALVTKPLAVSEKESVRRQPSVMTSSTARTTSVQSSATAQTSSSSVSSGAPTLGRRRSFLNRIRSQKKQPQDQVPAASPAAERLQEAYRLQQQQQQQQSALDTEQQTNLQQKNPGLGLDIKSLSPSSAVTSLKSPALSSHSGRSTPSYPPTPSTPGSVLMSSGTRSTSSQGAAKQSWFAGLFNWKAATYVLMSTENFSQTHTETKRLLDACGARVFVEDSENAGVLKCSLAEPRGEGGMSTLSTQASKPLRFRVVFQVLPTSSAYPSPQMSAYDAANAPRGKMFSTSVTLVQEKGSLSTFNRVHRKLQETWTLDNSSGAAATSAASAGAASPNMASYGLGMSVPGAATTTGRRFY